MNKAEAQSEKIQLKMRIDDNTYWLEYGGMSNPMKIKRRKKDRRICMERLTELNKLHPGEIVE